MTTQATGPSLDLDAIREEVRQAVIEGDASDCSSADCIADAVYEIVRAAAALSQPATEIDVGLLAKALNHLQPGHPWQWWSQREGGYQVSGTSLEFAAALATRLRREQS